MKRKLMIALLFVGALSLAACGGEEPATDAGGTGQSTETTDTSDITDETGTDGDTADETDATDTDETLVARTYEIGIDGMT